MAEEKFTNIIGVPFKEYVSKQLDIRAKNISTTIDRTNDNILFLANKNCWIKLTSFVTVEGGYAGNLSESTPQGTFLASKWILFGGTSYIDASLQGPDGIYTNNLRYGIEENPQILNNPVASITNGAAYGLGGVSQQGYKIMPGIQSARIQHMGTAGSLRSATINLYVGNKQQLDIIDMLYFRLGFSCLLEWGHTSYLDNNGNIQSNNIYPIDVFDINTISSKEDVLLKISEKKRASQGNYDAMYGAVSNYEWSINTNGGYDCNLKLMGLGSVIDSLKINQTFSMTDGGYEGSTQNKADGITQPKAQPTTPPPIPKVPQIKDNQIIYPQTGQSYQLDGSERVRINYNELLKVSLASDFKYTYLISNLRPDTKLKPPYVIPVSTKLPTQIASVEYNGKKLNIDQIPSLKKCLISKENKFKIYDPDDDTGAALNSFTEVDFPNTNENTPSDITEAAKFKIELLKLVNGKKIIKLTNDLKLKEPKIFNIKTGEVQGTFKSDSYSEATCNTIRLTYEIPYEDFIKNINILEDPYSNRSKLIGTEDEEAKNISFPALKSFYYVYVTESLPNLIKPFKVDEGTLTIDIGNVTPTNKDNTLDISVELKIIDKKPNRVGASGIRRNQVIAFITEIYKNITNTPIENSDLYNITQVEQSVTETAADNFLNDKGTKDKDGNIIITKKYTIGRIVYNYDPSKFNNQSNTPDQAPEIDLGIPESTLPKTITNNIDKFLIELRDEAVARGTEGKIDLYDFITSKLKTGVLDKIRTETENEPSPKTKSEIPTDPKKRLGYRIRKGFNTEIMAENRDDVDKIPDVDFRELFTAYKSTISDDSSQGETSNYIYIKLGLLLYYINNNSILYEKNALSAKETALKKPYIYIDFNPKTNFCLTTKFHFSVDPSVCLIPVNISQQGYSSLFQSIEINKNQLFNTSLDAVSKFINTGFSNETEIDESRGNIMNIGINIDFIINTLYAQQKQNEKSNSYLRPFLETVLAEINKSLGNLNNFRVGYDDEGNTVRIYDDQYVNPPSGQTTIDTNYTTAGIAAIPIFGRNSIARNITLKTGVSTAMSNQIAISSQAGNLGELNEDASSFGNINKNLTDRLMLVKEVADNPKDTNEKSTGDISSAAIFNNHIVSIYNGFLNNKTNADIAKNYYSTAANKLKADTPSTSIKPVLPLELNVTMDGISGMSLLEGFIIPTDLLPMQYLTNGFSKVGFAVMGLDQSIEGNQWTTTIKGQMINLPDSTKKLSNELGAADIGTAQGSRQTSNNISSEPVDIGNINLSGGYLQITYNILKTEEGFREKAYWDVNAYRVGYGNDKFIDKDNKLKSVQSNTVITEEQGSKTLIYTVKNNFEPGVIKQIGKENWDLLNDNQKAALLSYAYNAGAGALSNWNIAQEIKSKNYKAAANNIARGPITGGGKVYDVLIKRRKKESTIFLS